MDGADPQLSQYFLHSYPGTFQSSSFIGGPASIDHRVRKRTKTGCLTCRKRRIKCDETKPTCNQCIKSRRDCEGYKPRIVFKPGFDPSWPDLNNYPVTPYQQDNLPFDQNALLTYACVSGYFPTAPSIPGYGPGQAFNIASSQTHYGTILNCQGAPDIATSPHLQPIQTVAASSNSTSSSTPQYSLPAFQPPVSFHYDSRYSSHSSPTDFSPDSNSPTSIDGYIVSPTAGISQDFIPNPQSQPHVPSVFTNHDPTSELVFIPHQTVPTLVLNFTGISPLLSKQSLPSPQLELENFSSHTLGNFRSTCSPTVFDNVDNSQILTPVFVPQLNHPLDLHVAAQEYNDFSDYQQFPQFQPLQSFKSDEDIEILPEEARHLIGNQEAISLITSVHGEYGDLNIPGQIDYIPTGELDLYDASNLGPYTLRNPHAARVFMHFLSVTSASISIFERCPKDYTKFFIDSNTSITDQGLWGYKLPLMALHHKGLLHAMLALSSLHIAKLQNGPLSPAFKHYMYSIKRTHKLAADPRKRHLITTLAATLLLAFYEIMTADLSKWTYHLKAATYLIQETNFRQMSSLFKCNQAQAGSLNQFLFVDDNLISQITGTKVSWGYPAEKPADFDGFDLQKYQIYQDLFWWYARQDVYQSMISGNPLLLSYHRWADCPPRAAMGQHYATYGTHDHIILMFARITDFSARDRERKLQVMGKQWRLDPQLMASLYSTVGVKPPFSPDPSNSVPPAQSPSLSQSQSQSQPSPSVSYTTGGPSPSLSSPTAQFHTSTKPSHPPFFGMAPTPIFVNAPSSFVRNCTTPPTQSPTDSTKSPRCNDSHTQLSEQTALALVEWQTMYKTLTSFLPLFSPEMQPLLEDAVPTSFSPFGPKIQYRAYDIAVLWALYYAAHIVLLRAHPAMPPYALVASGVCAKLTAVYASKIGRIAAGMMPTWIESKDVEFPHTNFDQYHPNTSSRFPQPMSPAIGALLCEVMVPLFPAGMQFMDAAQRAWLVRCAYRIEAMSRWAAVGLIADGCESAWQRMGELGKGPVYQRVGRATEVLVEIDENENDDDNNVGGGNNNAGNVNNYNTRGCVDATGTAGGIHQDNDYKKKSSSIDPRSLAYRTVRLPPKVGDIPDLTKSKSQQPVAKPRFPERKYLALGLLGEEGVDDRVNVNVEDNV